MSAFLPAIADTLLAGTLSRPWRRPHSRSVGRVHLLMYRGVMSRTNVEIDDILVAEAMRRYRLTSKRAAVDFALRRLVGDAMSKEEALDMEGRGWDADLDEIRSSATVAQIR